MPCLHSLTKLAQPIASDSAKFLYRQSISDGKVLSTQGLTDKNAEDTRCLHEVELAAILALVSGKTGWHGELLRFPLRVGLNWTDRFQLQPRGSQARWEEGRYEVQAWERIKTPRGDTDAFKVVMSMNAPTGPKGKGTVVRTNTYYYAPEVKAIVSFREDGGEAAVTSTLIDCNVSK
jgi:hypothetical protein